MENLSSSLSSTNISSTNDLESLGCEAIFVDTEKGLLEMIDDLNHSLKTSDYINVDFEGVDLFCNWFDCK
jgi:hypothetical protein